MRSRVGSPRILSWRIASPQSSLLAAPPLDKGNEDSGNEIAVWTKDHVWSVVALVGLKNKPATSVCTNGEMTEIKLNLSARGFVQRMDNVIHRISVNKTNYAIHWIVIYPLDSVIHPLNNRALL